METETTCTDSGITYLQVLCPYCGACHDGTCPRVEELEYYPNGTLKRVRLRQEAVQVEVSTPDDHHQVGHTCGVDCPQTVW